MQPLKISIEGEYFDSHIYRDKLYLFDLNGVLRTYSWPKVLELWNVPQKLNLAVECAFFRGDFLYGNDLQKSFLDEEIRELVRRKFEELSKIDLHITRDHLAATQVAEQDSPFPFPHSSLEIYGRIAYAASSDGIYCASAESTKNKIIKKRAERIWDAPCSAISASWGNLAVSCGFDGLWQLPTVSYGRVAENVSTLHSSSPEWNYHCVFSSSNETGGYLAKYNREKTQWSPNAEERVFDRIISGEEIFGARKMLSWGNRDKICSYSDGNITVVKFDPFSGDDGDLFRQLDLIEVPQKFGDIVSAGTTAFGMVVEQEHGIVVVESDGTRSMIEEEPVNWKAFARSKMYSNQLHIIGSASLNIFSFNQDYFLSQKNKVIGSIPLSNRRWGAA